MCNLYFSNIFTLVESDIYPSLLPFVKDVYDIFYI